MEWNIMMQESRERAIAEIEEAFNDGRLSLIIDKPIRPSHLGAYVGEREQTAREFQEVTIIHVMSRAAGGECRGFLIGNDGALRLRLPCHVEWPELDAAVLKRVPGALFVASYSLTAGGMEESP